MSWQDELKMTLTGNMDITIEYHEGGISKLKFNRRQNIYYWNDNFSKWIPMKIVYGSLNDEYSICSITSCLGEGEDEIESSLNNLNTFLDRVRKNSVIYMNGKIY